MPSHTADRYTDKVQQAPRVRSLPVCSICSDTMVAAESSAIEANGGVSYLWSCDTCGHGFVTRYEAPTCH